MERTFPGALVWGGAAMATLLSVQLDAAASDTVKIVAPASREVLGCYPVELQLAVDFAPFNANRPSQFKLRLNREKIEDYLEETETGYRVLVSPENGLKVGTSQSFGANTLVSRVIYADGRVEKDRRRFIVRIQPKDEPTAEAGPDQVAFIGETVTLDGTGSSDSLCTPELKHAWRLAEVPGGSAATLADANTPGASFEADVPGVYVAELVVRNDAYESVADTVKVTVREIKALVHGPVDSAVYDALDHVLQPTTHDGTQNVSDFDIVVVDGDAHSPEGLSQNEMLNEAFHRGRHILAVDVSDAHKSKWLLGLMNAATEGGTDGIVIQQGKDTGGYPIIRMSEIPPPGTRESVFEDPDDDGFEEPTDLGLERQREVEVFETAVLDVLRDPSRWDATTNEIPQDLIHTRWVLSVPVSWTRTATGKDGPAKGRKQDGSHTTNYTFTLMLNNEASPQGDSQFLVVQANGEANPNDQGSQFLDWRQVERAWFQDQILLSIAPGSSQDGLWNWVASGPVTPNSSTTYSDSMSFRVGYQGRGPVATWGWSSGQSYTITDWAVKALGAQNAQSWNWRSQNHGNTDLAQKYVDYRVSDAGWFDGKNFPGIPNELCQVQMQYHASVAWKSKGLLREIADIDLFSSQHILDLWCRERTGHYCASIHTKVNKWLAWYYSKTVSQKINLAAVIPIPIQSIAFDPSKVVGGKPAKGTITLSSPAPMDIPITLKSTDETVATVTGKVTVKKGETSSAFDVLTLEQTTEKQVVIQAFYAEQFQAELTVEPKS